MKASALSRGAPATDTASSWTGAFIAVEGGRARARPEGKSRRGTAGVPAHSLGRDCKEVEQPAPTDRAAADRWKQTQPVPAAAPRCRPAKSPAPAAEAASPAARATGRPAPAPAREDAGRLRI